jgi:hypothetical protein
MRDKLSELAVGYWQRAGQHSNAPFPRSLRPLHPWRVLPYPILRRVSSPSGAHAAPPQSAAQCAARVHLPGTACVPAGGAGDTRECAPERRANVSFSSCSGVSTRESSFS